MRRGRDEAGRRDPRGASNRGRRRARTCISHLRARPRGTVDLALTVSAKAFTPERRVEEARGKGRRGARRAAEMRGALTHVGRNRARIHTTLVKPISRGKFETQPNVALIPVWKQILPLSCLTRLARDANWGCLNDWAPSHWANQNDNWSEWHLGSY